MKLGIYIQVPFCQTKCTYCNFHTGVVAKSLYEPYVGAVCRELRDHAPLYQAAGVRGVVGAQHASTSLRTGAVPDAGGLSLSSDNTAPRSEGVWVPEVTVDTIYIGGGTPGLLDPAALERILQAVRAAFHCELEEVTLEADPETVTPEKAAAWRAAGINRISFGAQSFNDTELKAAGRMHRREDIYRATEILRDGGFSNLSFDLIAGLPHQSAASWEDSLEQLLNLRPEHISIYLLEVDEGSRLGREVLSLGTRYSALAVPGEEEMVAFYDRARERLAAAGYDHYEISNWALVGQAPATSFSREGTASAVPSEAARGEGASAPEGVYRSKHNLKYWRREPYLGFGAGAHSFNGHQRWANAHDPAQYVAAITQGRLPIEPAHGGETLTPQQALEEELFLGLRQLQGIDYRRLEAQYNVRLAPRLERLRDEGLVEVDGSRVRLAPSRLTVSTEVFVELLG